MPRIVGTLTSIALAALHTLAGAQPSVPPDWDASVIDACESATGFAPTEPAAYADCKLTTTDTVKHEGRSVVWSFAAAAGAQELGLSHAPGPLKGRGAVSLWLKNPEGCALRLGLRLVDAGGRVFDTEQVPVDGPRVWQQVVFLTDDVRAAGGGEGTPEFPLQSLQIVVTGATAACTLYLDSLTAQVAPPEELEVLAIEAPPQVSRTSVSRETSVRLEVPVRARVRAPNALRRDYPLTLALTGGGVTVAEVEVPFTGPCTAWSAGAEIESEVARIVLPDFLAGGEYLLRLRAPGVALSGDAAMGVPLRLEGGLAERTTVTVAEHNGAPTAFIGEEPIGLWGRFWTSAGSAGGPTRLLIVPATAAHDPYGLVPDVWLSREEWDYQALDRSIIDALEAQPEASLILRVFIEAPDWWDAENPNELVLFSHGRHAAKMAGMAEKATFAAFASKKWRDDAREALRQFVAHVEQSPYADRVIGYMLAGGEDGRWRYWGAAEGLYADYSRPQRLAFIAWLRQRYNNDLRLLRGKWQEIVKPIVAPAGDEKPIPTLLSWDDVRPPDAGARTAHLSGALLDPAAAPEVADYNLFHAEEVAGFICDLAATAKGACERRKLVGVSYGHFLDHVRGPETLPNAGHLALDRVLTSTDIDLLAGPGMTLDGPSAQAVRLPASLAASVKAHGKALIGEVLPTDTDAQPALETAQMAALGGAVWYGGAGAWTEPPQTTLAGDRSSVAEVALIVDHFSLAYLAEGNELSLPLLAGQCASLARVGAPYDTWLLNDLIAGRMPDYKVYVFANAFNLDQAAREAVREQVARDGKAAVWVYAAGAIDESLSGPTALELTDLPIGFVGREAPLRVRVGEATHPLLEGVPPGLEYGPSEPLSPVFFAMPTRGEVLGTIRVPSLLDKGEPREWAGLIASEGQDWTTIYSAAPNVPAEVLRPIARRAGVHLYLETGDEVWASGSLLVVHALSAGDKRLRLPQPADVRDPESGGPIATKTAEFTIAMAAGETRLLQVTAAAVTGDG